MTKLKEKHTEFPAVPLSPSTGTAQLSTSATGATSSLQVTLLQRHHLEFVVHLRVCSCLVHFDLLTSKTLYLPSGHRVNKVHSPKHLKFCLLVSLLLSPFQSPAYCPTALPAVKCRVWGWRDGSAWTALAEDLGSVPGIHTVAHNSLPSVPPHSRGSNTLSGFWGFARWELCGGITLFWLAAS